MLSLYEVVIYSNGGSFIDLSAIRKELYSHDPNKRRCFC